MAGSWPSMIDPIQLADQGARLTAELPLKGMQRLRDLSLDDAGSARVDLRFERSANDGVRTLSGTIGARLRVTCQRCLEPFELELRGEPRLLLLHRGERRDAAEQADASVETLVVDQPVSLSMLVEDELLLAMPMIPMHAAAACPQRAGGLTGQQTTAVETDVTKTNPFAVLERLKRTDR